LLSLLPLTVKLRHKLHVLAFAFRLLLLALQLLLHGRRRHGRGLVSCIGARCCVVVSALRRLLA
jgi:hypothetical protein